MPASTSPNADDRTRALRALPEITAARDGSGTIMLAEAALAAALEQQPVDYGSNIAADSMQQDSQPPLPQPRRFLGYELQEMIGQGGMGAVFKAIHPWLGRTVAIKFLASQLARNPEALARFAHEARAVGSLDHPNIVRATDAGQSQGTPYLVTEFVAGKDLAAQIKQHGPLSVADACEVIRQAALGLQHAQERGLVHRDVKPSNLLLDPSGTVKLLDFGLARIAAGQTSITATGQMMGTLDFLAPEQACDAGKVDIRADIYSLGCTFYFLLTGLAPFEGPNYVTPASKLKGHLTDVPTLPRSAKHVPRDVSALLERMLAKLPEERFQTPREVAAALEKPARRANLQSLAISSDGNRRANSLQRQPSMFAGMAIAMFAALNPLRWFRRSYAKSALQPKPTQERLVSLYGIMVMLFLGVVLSRFVHFSSGPPGTEPQQPGITFGRVYMDESGQPLPEPVTIDNPNVKRNGGKR